ncbi:MAG TPA: site-specific DNA-methyltransferase [Candidatus Udaeobacter sp.]|jgi:adenine-specific DNA-methyltransferase
MARKKRIEQYEHKGKTRPNNPQVGLVDVAVEPPEEKKTYAYDPHIDPSLQWAGKAERTSFEVPSVSLHVHERIDPRTIIEAVRRKNGNGAQMSLFSSRDMNPPLREAIEFYKHRYNWTNRLIAGDSLLVMNSLIEKETLAGQVQMFYFDPPYGISYGSNFQPFINKRDVKDRKDDDLTGEPEMLRAFRDTWELGVHSYLTYLRDRLLLMHELLHDTGSIFVQISDENVHHVREVMDEVFGTANFTAQINFKSTSALGQQGLAQCYDYIVWYAKDSAKVKLRPLFKDRVIVDDPEWRFLDDSTTNLGYRKISDAEFHTLANYEGLFRRSKLTSSGFTKTCIYEFELAGTRCKPFGGKSWVTTKEGMDRLSAKGRLFLLGGSPYFKQYYDDFPVTKYDNSWSDQPAAEARVYVVQTAEKFIQRCMLMTTDPGDLTMDVTCGSGTTAVVAEQWGRRWITCDTSRVAVTLAKQRLMSSVFPYYELAHPDEGVDSGFRYKTVPHITLKSIANDQPPMQETLYDQPYVDTAKTRVTGPFTVEAVPAPMVKSIDEIDELEKSIEKADESIARSGETLRQSEWRDELMRTGIRGKNGQMILFSRVEPMPGTRWLHADAETKPNDRGGLSVREMPGQRAVISFGPEYAPLEQKQVELALEEARSLVPKPKIIVFAAFQFDPEAAKDIDETKWPGMTLLKAQMNADLLTEDLKKKRASNESFWLIGQPDVQLRKIDKGDDKGRYRVRVGGFDYYNTKTGQIESGSAEKIAMWMLDTNYDGRSLFPRQVFFPMAGDKEGWSKLARNLKAEVDEELIEAYRGTESLPFEAGEHNRVAVKIIDDRGIESLKIVALE